MEPTAAEQKSTAAFLIGCQQAISSKSSHLNDGGGFGGWVGGFRQRGDPYRGGGMSWGQPVPSQPRQSGGQANRGERL